MPSTVTCSVLSQPKHGHPKAFADKDHVDPGFIREVSSGKPSAGRPSVSSSANLLNETGSITFLVCSHAQTCFPWTVTAATSPAEMSGRRPTSRRTPPARSSEPPVRPSGPHWNRAGEINARQDMLQESPKLLRGGLIDGRPGVAHSVRRYQPAQPVYLLANRQAGLLFENDE